MKRSVLTGLVIGLVLAVVGAGVTVAAEHIPASVIEPMVMPKAVCRAAG